MGALFGVPSPSPMPPVTVPVEEDDTEEEERQKRIDALVRRRRGRRSMIATSPRGLLALDDWVPRRKTLLGE